MVMGIGTVWQNKGRGLGSHVLNAKVRREQRKGENGSNSRIWGKKSPVAGLVEELLRMWGLHQGQVVPCWGL